MLNLLPVLSKAYCIGLTSGIDSSIPKLVSLFVDIMKFGIPVLLIVFGMMDLAKAVMGNDEKKMKEEQGKFIKRCIYALIVFFVVAIVEFVVGVVDTSNGNTTAESNGTAKTCIDCFINGDCNADSALTTVLDEE